MVKVVLPALSAAESEFEQALGRINLDDMARLAESADADEMAEKAGITAVHDLDSFGAFPLKSKVEQFAGSLFSLFSVHLRAGAEGSGDGGASRGEGACRTRSGGAGALLVRGSADSRWLLRSAFRRYVRADEPPRLALHELGALALRTASAVTNSRHSRCLSGCWCFRSSPPTCCCAPRARWARLETSAHERHRGVACRTRPRQRAACVRTANDCRLAGWLG